MSVYKPKGSPYYHYDFQLNGRRYHGSTRIEDHEEAKRIVDAIKLQGGSAPLRPSRPSNLMYIAQGEVTRLVKIGITCDVVKRMDTLQTASPDRLMLLWHGPANSRLERRVHKSFDHLREHGEWFRAEEDLVEFILECRQVGVQSALAARSMAMTSLKE